MTAYGFYVFDYYIQYWEWSNGMDYRSCLLIKGYW